MYYSSQVYRSRIYLGLSFFLLELALDSACWVDHLRGSQQRKGQFSVCSITSAKSAGKYSRRWSCRETKERSFTGTCSLLWLADRHGLDSLMVTVMKFTIRFKDSKNLSKTFSLVMAKFSLLRSEGKIWILLDGIKDIWID